MDKSELPSDSDVSDEDYIPNGAEAELLSEEESDDAEVEEHDDIPTSIKRKSRTKNKSKKIKIEDHVEKSHDISKKNEEMTDEEKKKHEENLWAYFLGNDTKHESKPKAANGVSNEVSKNPVVCKKPEDKISVTKVFEFAGEEVRVDEKVSKNSIEARLLNSSSASTSSNNETSELKPIIPKGRGRGGLGLSAVLGQIGKKTKISTLEKSKLDWDRFKNKEGLTEEIQNHNKGKDGYLERQDFLQRTDLRQFEIEKQLRSTRKSNR